MIPLSEPFFTGSEWQVVKEAIDSGWVSSAGPYVEQFEGEFREYVGARHAVACVNGTAALHLALRVAGVSQNDEVLIPAVTFVATANVVAYCGADPVILDCDEFYNLDVTKTLEFLRNETRVTPGGAMNLRTGRRVAAVIPVHVFGNGAKVYELVEECRARKIAIVEDASESLGTRYHAGNQHTGTIGDLGCFSFNGNKIVTTGGGGMIVSENTELAKRARHLATQAKTDAINHYHDEVGYNYRLTSLQAAFGLGQLRHIEDFVARKIQHYRSYEKAIKMIPGLTLKATPDYARNNHWMYALQVDQAQYGCSARELISLLDEKGIQARPVWGLIHEQKPFRHCQTYHLDTCLELADCTLNIPCSVGLTDDQINTVIHALRERHSGSGRRRSL